METYVTEDIAALESDWQRLWMRCPHPHLSYEWHLAWNQHLRDDARALFIVAKDQGVVVGIAPLVVETVSALSGGLLKFHKISFHGRGFVDVMDFLTAHNETATDALCRAFLDLPGWDYCALRRLQKDSPTIRSLTKISAELKVISRLNEIANSPYIPIVGAFEAYYSKIGKNWRYQTERALRKLEREIGSWSFQIIKQPNESLLAKLRQLALERRCAGDQRGCPLLDEDRFLFLKELIPLFIKSQMWRVALLQVNHEIAAYQICFSSGGTVHLWSVAHHPAFESYSPGRLLLRLHLEACFHEGFHEFDFMAGDESYKGHWTREERRQDSLILSRKTWRTWLVRFIRQILPERLTTAEVVL